MEISEHYGAFISLPKYSNRLIFGFFHLTLSEYANQSHNFVKFSFCDIITSFLYCISLASLEPNGELSTVEGCSSV